MWSVDVGVFCESDNSDQPDNVPLSKSEALSWFIYIFFQQCDILIKDSYCDIKMISWGSSV